MLDLGFEQTIRWIVTRHMSKDERSTVMFSATFPIAVQTLAKDYLTNEYAMIICGDGIGLANKDISQEITLVPIMEKNDRLLELLRVDMKKYECDKSL